MISQPGLLRHILKLLEIEGQTRCPLHAPYRFDQLPDVPHLLDPVHPRKVVLHVEMAVQKLLFFAVVVLSEQGVV